MQKILEYVQITEVLSILEVGEAQALCSVEERGFCREGKSFPEPS